MSNSYTQTFGMRLNSSVGITCAKNFPDIGITDAPEREFSDHATSSTPIHD
jgi:hypothetical protein